MQNLPLSHPADAPENSLTGKAGTSEPSKPPGTPVTKSASRTLSPATTAPAGTAKPLIETLKPSDLDILRQHLSLLAGYLSLIQGTKRGRVLVEQLTMWQPNGKRYGVIKILIGVDEASAMVVEGDDMTLEIVETEATHEKK